MVPDRVAGRPDFPDVAGALRRRLGGSLALHLRCREVPARRQHRLARRLRREAERHGGWCVVNGRVDVALTSGAQAVQLGAGSLPVEEARRVLGRGVPVGRSVHGAAEAREAAEAGANFLLVGTIYATPSHPDRPGAGPERVARCRASAPVPVVAIGGIDAGRVAEVREAGASGVAAIRAIWDAPDPVAAAAALREAWDRAGAPRGT